MKNPKEKQQIIMLAVVLGLIAVVLLYSYYDRFLPKPTGDPVVLTAPVRLLMPQKLNNLDKIYERPDFQGLQTHAGIPVKPQEPNGSGSPFQTKTTAE